MITKRMQNWVLAATVAAVVAALALSIHAVAGPAPLGQASGDAGALAQGAWTSPWVALAPDQTMTFNHNLGGDPTGYAVELWFRDTDGGFGINRRYYGGMEVAGQWFGAHWQDLTSNSIDVHRNADDTVADRIRVRVWVPIDPPAFDSGWMDIAPGQTLSVAHDVGAAVEGLTVGLWFKSAARGIHNYAYGGLSVDGAQEMLGAHWQNLTSTSVEVVRHADDTDVEQVKVVVVEAAEPDYDSLNALGGWQPMLPGSAYTFEHNLNWAPESLLIRGECLDPMSLGIHQLYAGGNHGWLSAEQFEGVSLEQSTRNEITAFRFAFDEFCGKVRVRIWRRTMEIYLPLVVQNPL